MMSMEISTATLEQRVARDDFMQYKRVRNIITKADIPASLRTVSTSVACIPTFAIDPIFSNFILNINRLWSGLFFHAGVSWADLDDDKLPYTSGDF